MRVDDRRNGRPQGLMFLPTVFDQHGRRVLGVVGTVIPAAHGMQGQMRLRGGHGTYGGAQIINGDQRIPPLRGQALGERGFA
jgi:hypothetical protein